MFSLNSTGISKVAKIRVVQKLQQDTENDPFIKDQMANLCCVLVCAFGNFLHLFQLLPIESTRIEIKKFSKVSGAGNGCL